MAKGNSKGLLRDRRIYAAIADMNGEPFTASDLLDIMPYSRNMPTVREVGAVIGKMKRAGEVKYLGEAGTMQSRKMLEAAGLTQQGVRKTGLYIATPQKDSEKHEPSESVPTNDEE